MPKQNLLEKCSGENVRMKKKIKLRTQSRTKLAKHAIFAIEIKQNARAKKVEESRKCVLIPDQ